MESRRERDDCTMLWLCVQTGCHSVCERYISWKKELEAEKAYSKQFAPIDAMNLTHEQEKKNRQKRYKGGNQ